MVLVQEDIGLGEFSLAQRVTWWREPVRAPPAGDRAKPGAEVLHTRIARRLAQRACGRPLLVGIMHGEDLGVGLLVLFDQIPCVRVRAEAPRIDAEHVDCRFASDDPLGKLPAGAAGRRHTKRMAFVEPEVSYTRRRADNRRAVWRIGDGAVVDLLDAYLAKGRDTRDRRLDVGAKAIEILGKKLVFAVRRRPVDIAGGRAFFVRSQQQTPRSSRMYQEESDSRKTPISG